SHPARVSARTRRPERAALPSRGTADPTGLARAAPSRRQDPACPMMTRLLVVPGLALTIWLTGLLFTTDLAVPVRDVRRFKNVLMVFPHADDETVNCGGAIRRFSTAGATVTLLLLTGGERGNPEVRRTPLSRRSAAGKPNKLPASSAFRD